MELFHHSLSSVVLSEIRKKFIFSSDDTSTKTVGNQNLISSNYFQIFRRIKPIEIFH